MTYSQYRPLGQYGSVFSSHEYGWDGLLLLDCCWLPHAFSPGSIKSHHRQPFQGGSNLRQRSVSAIAAQQPEQAVYLAQLAPLFRIQLHLIHQKQEMGHLRAFNHGGSAESLGIRQNPKRLAVHQEQAFGSLL